MWSFALKSNMAAPLCTMLRGTVLDHGTRLPIILQRFVSPFCRGFQVQKYTTRSITSPLSVPIIHMNSRPVVTFLPTCPRYYSVSCCRHGWQRLFGNQNLKSKSPFLISRHMSSNSDHTFGNRTVLVYICAVGIFMVGAAYAGVPLYRLFCQTSGLGGQAVKGHDTSKIETMQPVKEREIRVRFNADTASSMQWNFRPQQTEVKVLPGETALAFYTAKNPTDKPIIGISTYNVMPYDAGQYFNKIQCFCFEEQRLNPHEQVDMPVFFYIDPEFVEDPKLEHVDLITLSYTFFESKEGLQLPLPGYVQSTPQVSVS